MRIVIVAVGRARRDPAQALYDDYAGRIMRAGPGLGFQGLTLREIAEAKAGGRAERVGREGAAISAAIEPGTGLVALDESGRDPPSTEFARWLAAERDAGRPSVTFAIGGADGLDRTILDRASDVFAFGRQTWPHLLVRAMLVEQLYRALTILGRHPYHRA